MEAMGQQKKGGGLKRMDSIGDGGGLKRMEAMGGDAGNKRSSLTPLPYNKDTGHRFSLEWMVDKQDRTGPPSFPETSPGGQDRYSLNERQNTEEPGMTFYNAAGHEDPPQGPLEFVEGNRFQTVVAVVIVANAIIIGLETDIHTPLWYWIEQTLLIFFVTELSLRILHNGPYFFHPDVRLGNIVDVAIVMSGVIDMWMMPVFEGIARFITQAKGKHQRNPVLQAMSILRMLRIIRLVRLVKIVQPLYRLATGVLEAMQGMFWVLVFLGMLLYAVAIICTRLIGHGAVLPDQEPLDKDLEDIQHMFHSVFSSMFVLFELMSCWSLIPLTPLFQRLPILKLLFVLFYIFSAWALLAVMTGVVSEKMIAVREQINTEEKNSSTQHKLDNEKLLEKFHKADSDNNLTINKAEFDGMMGDAESMRLLMQHANVNAQDLQDLFQWLDADKDGDISLKEFVEGFKWLNESVTPKSFVKLQEKLSSDLRLVEAKLVDFINDRFNKLISAVRQPLRKINAVTTQVQRLDASCSEMSQILRERAKTRLTRAGLAEAERRISARIDALLEAVETISKLQKNGLVTLKKADPMEVPKVRSASLVDGSRGFAV